MSGWDVTRIVLCVAVSAWLVGVAGAGQTTPGSGLLFIGDGAGTVDGNNSFDPDYPYPHMQSRAGDAVLGLSYGVVNWDAGVCTAGQQARLANWDDPDDDYEKLGAWGGGGYWKEITRAGRGLVRYDVDTYVVLSTQYLAENANGSRPPTLLQIEYYDDWFATPPYTQDQYLDSMNFDSMYLLRAAPRPGPSVQWGPRPLDTFLTPPGPCDWTWTGAGTVGKLQFADTNALEPRCSYAWNNDPNTNPTYDYLTFARPINYKTVDDNHQPGTAGALYKDSRDVSGQTYDCFSNSSALELAAFYGETENVLYMAQYAGRIYKMTGVKNLGWRRRAGQAATGTRLGDGTYVTSSPEWFFPVYVGGSTYAADASGGGPVIGDASQVDPNDPNSAYEGTAITSVELFNADPSSPLDPIVSGRHYTGLAVDCGGRVYAVSERVVAPPPPWKYEGTGADVWNGAPAPYGLNRMEKQIDPFDRDTWLFGDPNDFNPVMVGDVVVLTGGSLPSEFLNVPFRILEIDPNGYYAKLEGDCGDSAATFDLTYRVYPEYGPQPYPDPIYPWPSAAMVDVYYPDGSLITTIDLNTLTRPDGMPLGSYLYDGGNIEGVIAHGDVEIDPGLIYDPDHPTYPLPALPYDVTRLWIMGAGGDGDLDTDDGLDLLVVDVFLDWNGVYRVDLVGGIDDVDLPIGQFYEGDYEQGFEPWNLWISFGDLEFDGEGNMVYMGGRGINGNEYAGLSSEALRRAVYEMTREADPNDPNFGDGIVGVDAFDLDMNIYGFKTAFGLAFDNSPLVNHGAPPIPKPVPPPPWPDPWPGESLPKTQNNLLWVYFDYPISLPLVGYPLSIVDMHDATDVSGAFTYVIDPDDPSGHTLKATENGAQLVNQHWYTVSRSPGWDTVEQFTYDIYTLQGDCAPGGRVTTADYSCVKAAMGQRGDVRADLNGSGRVTTADYSVVKEHLGDRVPDKPAGGGRLGGYSDSGCLPPEMAANGAGDEYPFCGDEVVEVTVGPGTVHVVHRNAVYNCCPDEIRVTYTGDGASLQLFEQEILTTPCSCLCCYDVEATIVDLPPGEYVLQVFWGDDSYTQSIVVP